MTTKEKSKVFEYEFYEEDSSIEELSLEEKKKLDLELVKAISKKECYDNNINVSLFALNELKSIGFKEDLSTLFLSKMIEDVYHERNNFDSSDYFDLSIPDNEHYSKLLDCFVGDEQFCRAMIAVSIGNSDCETKNINDIVYNVINIISKKINNNNTLELGA